VSEAHRLLCGCAYIRVPGQCVGTAVPTVDVLSVCHDHGPKTPPRGAIPANPTTHIPPAECSDRRASSEGPAPSFEVSA